MEKQTINKPFLLIAGDFYYPSSGTDDWRGCFETEEEAMKKARQLNKNWFDIVDLREWVN